MKFMTHDKKGHKLTRLGLVSACAGLLVFFACPLATSTLAWFSIGSYTRVRNIELKFKDASLSAKLRVYGSSSWMLPDDEGRFLFSDEFSFSPVSGMFENSWYSTSLDPETAYPRLQEGYTDFNTYVRETKPVELGAGYIGLEFIFSATTDTYLFLDSSTSLQPDVDANSKAADGDAALFESLNKISSACRVSFFSNMGYTIYEPNVSEASSTYYGGRLNVRSSADGYYDYDSSGKEILYGEYEDEALEKLQYEVAPHSEPGDPFKTLVSNSKEGNLAITASSLEEAKKEGLIKKETSYTLLELSAESNIKHPVLYIPKGQERRLVVNIYLEGWDSDCELSLDAATLAASISFAGVYAPKGTNGFPLPVLGEDASNN